MNKTGQKILLGLTSDEETDAKVDVLNEIVGFSSLGGVKPSVVAENCAGTVQVFKEMNGN